jgi:hypothetical protein
VGSFWMAFTLSLSQKKYLKIKEMEWLRIRSHMSTVFVIHPCAGVQYTLRPKIIALLDFYNSRLTIRLIWKNCTNIIYFAITYFITIYILSIS